MQIDVRVDTSAFNKAMEALGTRDARAAVNRALTRASRSTVAEANRAVREELNIKASALSGRSGRTITTTKPSNQSATVRIKGQGVPLSEFRGTRELKASGRGLSVQVLKGGRRKVLASRFLHPLTGTSIEREQRGTKRVPRIPVRVLFGPSVAQVIGRSTVLGKLTSHAETRFMLEFQRELLFRLTRRTGAP